MTLSRSKPIARRRAKPRKVKVSCVTRGCKRPPTAGTMCVTHAKVKADKAWSARVRNGNCDLAKWHNRWLRCGGVIQGCHGWPAGHMGTRYLLENGFSGCGAVNQWMEWPTNRVKWDQYLREFWGEEKYAQMRDLAMHFGEKGESIDYPAVIAMLTGQKEEA